MDEGKVLTFLNRLKKEDKEPNIAAVLDEERQALNLAVKIARLRLQKAS
jgi:hypothetical protein